jgi:hypothetical protein
MKSKPATKETGAGIYCTATAMKPNPYEIPILTFARRRTDAGAASVIPVPLASSVIWVVTQSWDRLSPL